MIAAFAHEKSGPGWTPEQRIYFDKILNAEQAKNFTLSKVFGGKLDWIDFLY